MIRQIRAKSQVAMAAPPVVEVPLSWNQQLDEIIVKKPSVGEVRKFFRKVGESINQAKNDIDDEEFSQL